MSFRVKRPPGARIDFMTKQKSNVLIIFQNILYSYVIQLHRVGGFKRGVGMTCRVVA